MNYLEKVEEFQITFKSPVLPSPTLIDKQRAALRIQLIQEELDELKEAVANDDLVEVADALADLQYVLSGTILEFGMKDEFNNMFAEVHRSNMSKVCKDYDEAITTESYYINERKTLCYSEGLKDGSYLIFRSSDDKILKSINYSPAELSQFL